jgi:hypothetical protein
MLWLMYLNLSIMTCIWWEPLVFYCLIFVRLKRILMFWWWSLWFLLLLNWWNRTRNMTMTWLYWKTFCGALLILSVLIILLNYWLKNKSFKLLIKLIVNLIIKMKSWMLFFIPLDFALFKYQRLIILWDLVQWKQSLMLFKLIILTKYF